MYIIRTKGDEVLREIKIRIQGTGINNICQAYVCIYNSCGGLVYEGWTYNGCVCVKLNTQEGYTIIIKSHNGIKRASFYVDCYTQCYAFSTYELRNPQDDLVTFLLTDLNYDNLPIMKGEIILWQNQ